MFHSKFSQSALTFLLALVALASITCPVAVVDAQLIESERLAEYHARNYTWPPKSYVPNTEGWTKLMEHRLRQVSEIDNARDRYEGFIQTLNAAIVAPNFTQYGWGLAKAPDELMAALRKGIHDGVNSGQVREEGSIDVIDGELKPWFIDRPDLTKRVLSELQSYPETWVNMELQPYHAYGFRLYRNQSRLHMHVDKSNTHIVSFILHIDSSEDAEPWPILIEDFEGNTHEVVLASGDMVFYESSKVFHGRPHKFVGSWYSSIFVHYFPKYGWMDSGTDHNLEKHFAVPPAWSNQPTHHFEIPLQMVGTAMKETDCPNEWCQSQYALKWNTSSQHGKWIDPTGCAHDFDPKPIRCTDDNENCSDWASWNTNECRTNPGYMLKTCRKSCHACTLSSRAGFDEL